MQEKQKPTKKMLFSWGLLYRNTKINYGKGKKKWGTEGQTQYAVSKNLLSSQTAAAGCAQAVTASFSKRWKSHSLNAWHPWGFKEWVWISFSWAKEEDKRGQKVSICFFQVWKRYYIRIYRPGFPDRVLFVFLLPRKKQNLTNKQQKPHRATRPAFFWM